MPHFIAAYPPAYGEWLNRVNFSKVDDESENPDSLSKTKSTSEQSSHHRLQTNLGNPARSLRLSPERCQKKLYAAKPRLDIMLGRHDRLPPEAFRLLNRVAVGQTIRLCYQFFFPSSDTFS